MCPPVSFVRLDPVAIGAKDLEVAHLLLPKHDTDTHGIPSVRWFVFLAGVDVVNVENSLVAVPARDALAPKRRNDGELALPIPRAALLIAFAFAAIPMATPAVGVAETPTSWSFLAACRALRLVAEAVLAIAFAAAVFGLVCAVSMNLILPLAAGAVEYGFRLCEHR